MTSLTLDVRFDRDLPRVTVSCVEFGARGEAATLREALRAFRDNLAVWYDELAGAEKLEGDLGLQYVQLYQVRNLL